MNLILASKSPRRKDILIEHGYKFKVKEADFIETDLTLLPIQTAVNNALGKATAVFNAVNDKSAVVLGADTVVFYNGEILGKPTSPIHAVKMLKTLSNATHTVVTGFAIVTDKHSQTGFSETQVTFNELSEKLILDYVASGSPLDKAGAYGIQDDYPLVKEFVGSLNNVIGLPIEQIKPILDGVLRLNK